MLQQFLALRGEADAKGRVRQRGHVREDVGVLGQFKGELARTVFLDFLRTAVDDVIVGNRRDRNEDVALAGMQFHRIKHLARRLHVDTRYVEGRRQAYRAAHQCHLGASSTCRISERIAHLAGAVIGDDAHRVDRLLRRPRRDEHALAA